MPEHPGQPKEILTLQELADERLIPVGKRTIVKYAKSGELPGANFRPAGGKLDLWRFRRTDVLEFVERKFRSSLDDE